MGNCFSFAHDHMKRLKLPVNCFINSNSRDDQVMHLELPENDLSSPTDDDHVKNLQLLEEDLINSSDDQGIHLELPENELISPSNDQVKHPELPESGLIFLVDSLQHLEWLENNHDFSVPIKDQIQILKVELRFLRTYLKGLQGKDLKDSLGEPIIGFLQNAASKLFSLCLRPSTDRSMTRDLEILISTMQEEMYKFRPGIKSNYLTAYFDSKRNDPTKNKLVMELVDTLLENLKDLRSSETKLIISVKSQLEALEEKLLFVQNLFRFSTMGISSPWLVGLGDSGDDNEREMLESLLTRIEYVADNAAFLSYSCLVDKEQENVRLKCNLVYLVWMIKHIEPEVKEICLTFLKDFEPLNSETLPFNLHRVVAIDSLLDNLVRLHNCESHFMAPVKDDFLILYDELIFLRTFLMDPPPRKNTEDEKMDSLLNSVELLFIQARSAICSFLDKMEVETANEMNLMLFSLLAKIDLIKSEARDRYSRRLNDHLQSNSLGVDGVGYIDSLLKDLDELLNCQEDSIIILRHQIESVLTRAYCKED